MFEEVKAKLIENPASISNILATFDFGNIKIRNNEIRCGFTDDSNPSAIRIKLEHNDNLFVSDYVRGYNLDLINYIIKSKGIQFGSVINAIKSELGIDNLYDYRNKPVGLFGGLYDRIGKSHDEIEIRTYPESILDQYINIPNERFLRDGLSLDSQKRFEISYDIISQRIIIPIRNLEGNIIAIKGRINYESDEESKYIYLEGGIVSSSLYGAYQNYNSLYEADEIFVFESEKSVIKMDSWGMNNAVALMSNSLSPSQAKILMSMCPRKITFMLDDGLPIENTLRNIEVLKAFAKMKELKIAYWDWNENIELSPKSAPVDGDLDTFKYILENEIVEVE